MASNGWIWSAQYQDHYYVTRDSTGQPVCHWASQAQPAQQQQQQQQQPLQPQSQPRIQQQPTTYHHTRNDSAASPSVAIPAEPVPLNARQQQPNSIAGSPEQGWYDQLGSSYRMRTGSEAHRFFILGRVFSMLYTEAAGGTALPAPEDEAFTVVRFGGRVHTQIRRFVIVSVRQGFVHACAISTYRNQGTFKRGCDPSEHALVFNTGVNPDDCLFPGEYQHGMTKTPIEVRPADGSAFLTRESRIRFGKTYSIEWNVKVKDIGAVVDDNLSTLLAHYESENTRWGAR